MFRHSIATVITLLMTSVTAGDSAKRMIFYDFMARSCKIRVAVANGGGKNKKNPNQQNLIMIYALKSNKSYTNKHVAI